MLPVKLSDALTELIRNCCSAIDKAVSNAKLQLEQLISSVKSAAPPSIKLPSHAAGLDD